MNNSQLYRTSFYYPNCWLTRGAAMREEGSVSALEMKPRVRPFLSLHHDPLLFASAGNSTNLMSLSCNKLDKPVLYTHPSPKLQKIRPQSSNCCSFVMCSICICLWCPVCVHADMKLVFTLMSSSVPPVKSHDVAAVTVLCRGRQDT